MRKTMMLLVLISVLSASLLSCGPKCKKCSADIGMGIKSPEKELCGDELKEAEKLPGMVCK